MNFSQLSKLIDFNDDHEKITTKNIMILDYYIDNIMLTSIYEASIPTTKAYLQ